MFSLITGPVSEWRTNLTSQRCGVDHSHVVCPPVQCGFIRCQRKPSKERGAPFTILQCATQHIQATQLCFHGWFLDQDLISGHGNMNERQGEEEEWGEGWEERESQVRLPGFMQGVGARSRPPSQWRFATEAGKNGGGGGNNQKRESNRHLVQCFASTIKNLISSPEVGPHEIHLFTFHPNSVISHFDFLEFCFVLLPFPIVFLLQSMCSTVLCCFSAGLLTISLIYI